VNLFVVLEHVRFHLSEISNFAKSGCNIEQVIIHIWEPKPTNCYPVLYTMDYLKIWFDKTEMFGNYFLVSVTTDIYLGTCICCSKTILLPPSLIFPILDCHPPARLKPSIDLKPSPCNSPLIVFSPLPTY
jgi:hypothetical protein